MECNASSSDSWSLRSARCSGGEEGRDGGVDGGGGMSAFGAWAAGGSLAELAVGAPAAVAASSWSASAVERSTGGKCFHGSRYLNDVAPGPGVPVAKSPVCDTP